MGYLSKCSCCVAAGLAVLAFLTPAEAADPPMTRVIEGPAISPSAAITELGSATTHTNSTGAARHTEFDTFAASLHDDPDLIYEYVYNNVETIPVYGLKNGALGALIDGKGTSFDQAQLMVELLRAAGFTAQYRYGTVTLSTGEFSDLFGTASNREACELLRDGGFGMSVGTYTDCSALSGVNVGGNRKFTHVWVQAQIGGTFYSFDPSIKTQTEIAGWDMGAKMSYNDTTFWAAAGVTNYNEMGVLYASGIDASAIETELEDYAVALVNKMREEANHALSVTDIAGGREIVPIVVPSGGQRVGDPNVGHNVALSETWTGDIPDQHRTKVTIAYNGSSFVSYGDDLYGRRLWFLKSGSSLFFMVGEKRKLTPAHVTGATLDVTIDHPYAASSSTLGDHTETFNPPFQNSGTAAALVLSFGPTGPGLLARYNDGDWQAMTPPSGIFQAHDNGAIAQMSLGASWLAQATLLMELADGVNEVKTVRHDSVGLISGDGTDTVSPMMDIRSQIALTDPASVGTPRTAAIQTLTSAMVALEGAALDQLADTSTAASAVADLPGLFVIANSDMDNRFYDVTSSNWPTVRDFLLTNYSTDEKADLESFINSGNRLILPKDGDLAKPGFTGVAYIALNGDDRFGHLLDDSALTDKSHIKAAMVDDLITDLFAVSTASNTIGVTGSSGSDSQVVPAALGARSSATDLRVGTGSFPYSLSFTRSFRPDAADGTVGGWTHNFDITGKFTSDGLLALGNGSAVDAARAMVALYVGREVLRGGHTVERITTGVLIQDWLHRGLFNNIFRIVQAHASVDFVKLADNDFSLPAKTSFNSPDGEASNLQFDFNVNPTTATFTAKSGVEMKFNAVASSNDRDFRIDKWSWPAGMELTFTYPTDQIVVTNNISINFNRSLTIDLDADGQATKVADNAGRHVDYTYVGDNITNATLVEGTDSQSLLDYSYSGDELDKISTPETTDNQDYSHNALGQVIAIASADAGTTQFYQNAWRSEVVDPSGASVVTIRDPYGRWVKTTNGVGETTTTTLDRLGRVTRVEAPEENAVTFTYDKYHSRLTATNKAKPGTLDSSGNPFVDQETEFAYLSDTYYRQLDTATDPLGNVTTFAYSASTGLLSLVTQPAAPVNGGTPDQPKTRFVYNGKGQLIEITDPADIITTLTYTGGELTSTKADDDSIGGLNIDTSFTYTSVGDLLTTTNHRGNTTTYDYDMLRRQTKETGPTGSSGWKVDYTYDDDGRLTQTSYGSGLLTTRTTYDARGRVTAALDNASKITSLAYDDVGRTVTATDPLQRKVRTEFDAAGRRIKVTAAFGSAIAYTEEITYNPNGTIATLEDGEGNITGYTYDGFDRLIKTTYPDASFEEITDFDEMGRPTEQKTRNGDTITLTYDAAGRLESRLVTGGTQYDYQYDIRGQVTKILQGTPEIAYTYDNLGRPLSETGVHGRKVEYAYFDATGQSRVKYNHPGAENDFTALYFTDSMGRVNQVKVFQAVPGTRNLMTYAYDAASRMTQKTLDIAGVTIAYGFDAAGRLNQAVHDLDGTADDVTLDYTRNDAGQVTGKSASNAAYLWNSLPTNGTDNYVANALNQYSSTPLPGTPSYDTNGNMTSDGVFSYIFDAENRLTEAKNGSGITVGTYQYDPLGRRSEKTDSLAGVTTEYLYSGGQVLAEYDGGTGNLNIRYVYGPGLDDPIAMLNEDGDVTYFHDDGRGTVIALSEDIDPDPNVIKYGITDIFTHGPYGELGSNTGGSAYKYTARRIDEETGLYYYRYRYYHPKLGRFMSADPIGYGGGLNMYAYVGNDPMNNTDPWGLFTCTGSRINFNPDNKGPQDCDDVPSYASSVLGGGLGGFVFGLGGGGGVSAGDPPACGDGCEKITVTAQQTGLTQFAFDSILQNPAFSLGTPASAIDFSRDFGGGREATIEDRVIGLLTLVGGVGEVVLGTTICTSGIGCAAGAFVFAFGVNNLYEGGNLLLYGYSGIGPVRAALNLGFGPINGDIIFNSIDFAIGVSGLMTAGAELSGVILFRDGTALLPALQGMFPPESCGAQDDCTLNNRGW